MKIFTKSQIEKALDIPKILEAIEKGFEMYSQGQTVIPPVGSLHLPLGDCHIKYGYAKEGSYYVVKIASSFYQNAQLGIPSGNGVMLLFDQKTGALVCILHDEGYLTDLRTAAAGAIAAKHLAPKNVTCIGIVGTGAQAFYQLSLLSYVSDCKNVMVWGRDPLKAERFCNHPQLSSFNLLRTQDLNSLTSACNLIVMTTSSTSPLLFEHQINKGTHITAVGADDLGKQELDARLFLKADRIVVDSKSQCKLFGDTSYALKEHLIEEHQMIELGEVIHNPHLGRTSAEQITIVDLTGVAIQDLQIATAVYEHLNSES